MRVAVGKHRPPLSARLLFAPVFVAVYLLHWTLLRLPYYWDEGSYYIPAAWDFYRLGTLIPETTMRNAHPPLPSILLAGWWKLAGFHVYSTRLLMCLVSTAGLLSVFRLARLFLGDSAALAVMTLTAIYPVWFAQSTLAHADMFAAAFALWGLVFYADRKEWTQHSEPFVAANAISAALLFALAALSKETAIVLPAALFLFEAFLLLRDRSSRSIVGAGALRMAALALPALPLLGWYMYHRAMTGFMFGNPEFLRYNATANFSACRVMLSLWHRFTHLAVHMNLFVPVLTACGVLFLPRRSERSASPSLSSGGATMLTVLLAAEWIAFSVLGGALLTRYLLPAYPLVLILCLSVWKSRTRQWPLLTLLTLAVFAIGCEQAPPYAFTPEDNLSYRDMIVVHQHAIHELLSRYPGATVLTAWPVAADLQRPELGYVEAPVKTISMDNFSAEEVAKAKVGAGRYDVGLVFSTKFDPPPGGLNLTGDHRANDHRFYDYHRDLLPMEIARALGGSVVWQEERKGEWAAVLQFPRAYDAQMEPHPVLSGARSRRL